MALTNMGSLPHISFAGASATGTHGSGDKNPILSSALRAFTFMSAAGQIVTLEKSNPLFEACRLGLGAYGLWVGATIDVVPTYQMRQDVFLNLTWDKLLEDVGKVTSAGHSVSLFTRWGSAAVDQVWIKSGIGTLGSEQSFLDMKAEASLATEPIAGIAENLTLQGGISGPWLERLPHFKYEGTPSAGDEIQSEFFVDRDNFPKAVEALNKAASQINHALMISEIRTVAKDEAWLSPMNRGDQIALHFTWFNNPQAVEKALTAVERALEGLCAIPHWGKLHHYKKDSLELLYPKLGDAREVFDDLDPEGKFRTDYLVGLGIRT